VQPYQQQQQQQHLQPHQQQAAAASSYARLSGNKGGAKVRSVSLCVVAAVHRCRVC
jgi:hypothetical protein